jgi:hypothetical protein
VISQRQTLALVTALMIKPDAAHVSRQGERRHAGAVMCGNLRVAHIRKEILPPVAVLEWRWHFVLGNAAPPEFEHHGAADISMRPWLMWSAMADGLEAAGIKYE